MVLERQTETIDFLASPATHGGAPVERIDTHADAEVIRMQLKQDVGTVHWHRIQASSPADAVLQRATTYLTRQLPNPRVLSLVGAQ
jgi:hypothetical protein